MLNSPVKEGRACWNTITSWLDLTHDRFDREAPGVVFHFLAEVLLTLPLCCLDNYLQLLSLRLVGRTQLLALWPTNRSLMQPSSMKTFASYLCNFFAPQTNRSSPAGISLFNHRRITCYYYASCDFELFLWQFLHNVLSPVSVQNPRVSLRVRDLQLHYCECLQ